MGIPIKTVSLEEMMGTLDSRILSFEEIYETSSEEMCRKFSEGSVVDTEELVEWMQVYLVRQSLCKPTPTTGILGTTTVLSTTSTKRAIPS